MYTLHVQTKPFIHSSSRRLKKTTSLWDRAWCKYNRPHSAHSTLHSATLATRGWLPQVVEIISRPLFLQIFVAVRLFLEPIPEMLVYTKHQNIANKPSQAGRTPGNFRVGTPGVRQRTLRPPGIKSKFSTGGGRVLKFLLKHA